MKLLLVAFILSFSITTYAQTDSISLKRQWTLRECIDYAVVNNLTVKQSELTVESSQIDYNQAKWALAPSINAGGTLSRAGGRSVNSAAYQYTTEPNTSLNPYISGSITVFNGFKLQNTIKQTSTALDASEYDLQKSKNDVILNVVNLYMNVIFNKELYENARYQLQSSQEQLNRIKKQVAVGSLPKSDELNQEAQVATNELNLINQENAVNLTLLQLKQALQLPAETPLDVVVPEITVEDLILEQTKDEIFNSAFQNMPEIKSADLRVKSTSYGVRASRGNLTPRLTLSSSINSNYSSVSRGVFVPDGGIDTVATAYMVAGTNENIITFNPTGTVQNLYGFKDQLNDNMNKSISLNLTIPIFSGFQNRASVQRARISYRSAEITRQQTANTLRQNVETAYNNALAASKTFASSSKQVQAREEALRMTKQRYDIGGSTYVEYQLAENQLFQSRSDLVRAKYEFIFRKKVLDFYQNKPIDF